MVQVCIYLGQYLATCKHCMQALPSPTSGMLCGALVAIVQVLRQDCYCLSALHGTVAVSISLAWSGCCYNRFLLCSLPSGIPHTANRRPHTVRRTSMAWPKPR